MLLAVCAPLAASRDLQSLYVRFETQLRMSPTLSSSNGILSVALGNGSLFGLYVHTAMGTRAI